MQTEFRQQYQTGKPEFLGLREPAACNLAARCRKGNFNKPRKPPEGFDAQVPQDGEAPQMPEGNLDGTSGKQPGHALKNVSAFDAFDAGITAKFRRDTSGRQNIRRKYDGTSEPSVVTSRSPRLHSYSFSGVGDYAEAVRKDGAHLHVNEDDTGSFRDTSSIVYNGADQTRTAYGGDRTANTFSSYRGRPLQNYSETFFSRTGQHHRSISRTTAGNLLA
jgi:hypothetical protein